MSPVEHYIYEQEGIQRDILLFLHQHLLTYPPLTPKIRYKIPFYYGKTWVCYLNPIKKEQIELVFVRGNELSNDQRILESRGRKQVKGLICSSVDSIPLEALIETITEALILDKDVPYSLKSKK
ncbi:MAG: DUF1801 domain-containing protein [Bacteroidota bacterium]